ISEALDAGREALAEDEIGKIECAIDPHGTLVETWLGTGGIGSWNTLCHQFTTGRRTRLCRAAERLGTKPGNRFRLDLLDSHWRRPGFRSALSAGHGFVASAETQHQ